MEFFHPIRDHEALVVVRSFYRQRPDSSADNPDDYYGYTEADYDLFLGEMAWYPNLSADEDREIVQAIADYVESINEH
jgi:putative SOS response-associated peptidase YedK